MNTPKLLLAMCALLLATPAYVSAQNAPESTLAAPASPSPLSALPSPTRTQLRTSTPARVLFVGNSYLYYGDSVHNHVERMAIAAGVITDADATFKSATIGGAAIGDHDIDHLLTPKSLRVDQPFEVVILQGGSFEPLSPEGRAGFAQTIAAFSVKIRQTGAEPVLYMTHAYVVPHLRRRPDMISDIAAMYLEAGNQNDALVIPVGLAFEIAYARQPDIQLHKAFDGSHPNLDGTYLAAATAFASLYGVSPVGNSYNYFGAVDPETALFLQTVAQDTVTAFRGSQSRPPAP
jgi:hypothetical protein